MSYAESILRKELDRLDEDYTRAEKALVDAEDYVLKKKKELKEIEAKMVDIKDELLGDYTL